MTWTFRNFDTTVFLKLFSRAIFKRNLNLPRFFDHTEIIYSIDYSIYIYSSLFTTKEQKGKELSISDGKIKRERKEESPRRHFLKNEGKN